MQTWLIHRVASYLSSELKTTVTIGSVDIEFLKTAVLRNILIRDLQGDTLLLASEIKADIGFHQLTGENKKLTINNIELNNSRIKLIRYKNINGLNVDFLANYFSAESTDTASSSLDFSVKKIKLNNIHFSLLDLRWNDYTPCVDFEDLDVLNFSGILSDINFNGDTVLFSGNNISFIEKKGFEVTSLSAKTKIAPGIMHFNDLKIVTPFSDINTQLTFSFDSIENFDHFLTQVRIKSDFKPSTLSSIDIAFFARQAIGLNQQVLMEGKLSGTVASAKAKNLHLKFGDASEFVGDVSMNGLPDIEETFMNLKISRLTVNKKDVEKLKAFPFDSAQHIQLPQNLARLGNATFSGVFTGFYNDFVAYGNIRTAIGFLSTDLNLKFNSDMQKSSYSGKLVANNFDFGKFWSRRELGQASFDAKLTGSGFSSEKVKADFSGNIYDIFLNGYNYKNITLDGNLQRKLFTGSIHTDEKDIKLGFSGTVDFRNKLPVFDFVADIYHANPTRLNWIKRDTTSAFSAKINLNLVGLKIDELDGTINISDLSYHELNNTITARQVIYFAGRTGNDRIIKLNSDFADIQLQGNFRLVNTPSLMISLLGKYMPPVILMQQTCTNENQQFNFSATLKKTDEIFKLLVPGLNVANPSSFSGRVDGNRSFFTFNASIPNLNYNDFNFKYINADFKTSGTSLDFNIYARSLIVSDSISLDSLSLSGKTDRTKGNLDFKILNADSTASRVDIHTVQEFSSTSLTTIKFLPSVIKLQNNYWTIDPGNSIVFDSSRIQISRLEFVNGTQSIRLDGNLSARNSEALNIGLKDFNTSQLNPVLKIWDANVGGVATGVVRVVNYNNMPQINAGLKINTFSYWRDTIGDVNANLSYNRHNKAIDVNAFVEKAGRKEISVTGSYLIKQKNDELDFTIYIDKANVSPFGRYLNVFASEVKGLASADLRLTGLASKPLLTGKGKIQKGGLKVDYLNTRYFFAPEDIVLTDKMIHFSNVELTDEKGNKARLDGKIFHTHLKDFVFDFSIRAKKLFCLNTNASQNELFYGTGYASGTADIYATQSIVNFELGLRTEKGTQIFIPLNRPEEVSQKNFITFLSADTLYKKVYTKQTDLSGIYLDFNLEATPDAEVQLIFDSKIGDVMKGRGSGNLTLQIDPLGDFTMLGDYSVSQGDYLFTLQNVVNKKFTVERGGRISWSGSPYNAILDINANYNLRASTYDLLHDTTSRSRIPVILGLHLTGYLLNPDVNFTITAPDLDPAMQNQFRSSLSSEQELNRQVFSLLVLNRFSAVDQATASSNNESSSNDVGKSLSEFASVQLSRWLSNISSDVDIGVNYRPADALNPEEFEVSLSTDLFNDRVSIGGNFGVGNNNSQATSGLVGDFNVEFKATREGRLRFRAFNKTNSSTLLTNLNSQYTQGIGVFYREEFNTFSELLSRFRHKKKKRAETTAL